jgi:hypothetical protein
MVDATRQDRPMKLTDVRRDVEAHLEYRNTLVKAGRNTALIDCLPQLEDVAMKLVNLIDAGMQP